MQRRELEGALLRYERAAAFLPVRLRKSAGMLSDEQRAVAEEFRLRIGRPMTILLPSGEWETADMAEAEDLEILCNLATEFSRYAAAETIREGYLPVRGGFRVGLCGTAVVKDGVNTNLKDLSSAVIRIAREMRGIATDIAPRLFREGRFVNTLILSPPGGGKTTLLRDLVRCISEGTETQPPLRVSLIDERGEVAVMYRGEAQMDVGGHTDVLDGCPKALGIPIILRAMNPQMIAVDEITRRADLEAVSMANGCGVGLLATIHAASAEELLRKPLYAELLSDKVFLLTVKIVTTPEGRRYQVEELPC